jgi:hypothetical protein
MLASLSIIFDIKIHLVNYMDNEIHLLFLVYKISIKSIHESSNEILNLFVNSLTKL